jgi:hypothetical protein
MELVEPIETLNKRLVDYFGVDTVSGQPMYRIVFSEDQFEKRLTNHTKEGLELLTPQMVELPKYRQWIHDKYVLEQLVVVPAYNEQELSTKTSYEPLHAFQDGDQNYLPPKWEITKFIIDLLHSAKGRQSMRRYADDHEGSKEERELRIKALEDQLFGNETDVGDALAHKQGVVVPENFERGS